jgi:hypothetical protein
VRALKFISANSSLSGFSGAEALPRGRLTPLSEGAPDSPVHTGQSGAPKTTNPIPFSLGFLNRFRSNL